MNAIRTRIVLMKERIDLTIWLSKEWICSTKNWLY